MKSLENLKDVLSDVEINEEQKKALDSFFEELYESLKEKAYKEIQNESFIYSQEDMDEAMNDAEAAFEMAMRDAERAFDMAMNDAEAAFEMAMGDAERAFEMFEEDITEQHSKNMIKALEDIYESLLERAKEEVLLSPQFESLNKIKEILSPFIIEESNSESLLKENKKLKEALRFVHDEKNNLERNQIIESLISELPNKEKSVIRTYIEEANSIDEIYERYNLAISILEAKEEDEEFDEEEIEEIEEENFEEEEEVQAESVIYSESRNEKINTKPKRYSSIEEAIISSVFK